MTNIISFPHMGNYYIPIKYLVSSVTNCKVLIPPQITKKTIAVDSSDIYEYVTIGG